jgi:hypothetical protein
MTTERKPLSSVNLKAVIEATQAPNTMFVSFRDRKGKIIFKVHEDHLFDAEGNPFEIDVAFQGEG